LTKAVAQLPFPITAKESLFEEVEFEAVKFIMNNAVQL
jgi:hypothetical protein